MEIYKCGTEVTLKDALAKGRIIAVQMEYEAVSYKVSYFENLKRITEWFNENEFTTEANQVKIGYVV